MNQDTSKVTEKKRFQKLPPLPSEKIGVTFDVPKVKKLWLNFKRRLIFCRPNSCTLS